MMNEYRYDSLYVGKSESFQYNITEEKMDLFCKLTGDINPLHVNSEFAHEHGFQDRVVYGMLSASLISTLGGVFLPGRYCLIHQVECKFLSPVYIGDELTVCGTVKELNDSVRQAVIKIEIKNQKEEKVIRSTLKVGFLK
jgi:3-hydroxybutyryl-CoA dehydratase